MKIFPFQAENRKAVLRLDWQNHEHLRLEKFLWQPCRQIESLEKDCFKIVCQRESIEGYAAFYKLDETHFRLNLLVAPQCKRRKIGTELLHEIEAEARRQNCLSLQARTLEKMPGGLEFALENNFAKVHRMRGMSLRAKDFSFAKWKKSGEKLAAENFVVTTLQNEIEEKRQPFEKLVALHKRAVEGWALTDPTVSHNVETEYLKEFFAGAKKPARVSIIKHGDEYVGYTSAERTNMLGTAIHPDYRGRGLATFLKAFDLKMQIDDGVTYIETATASDSMIRVNQKLGYKANGLTEIRLLKYF